MIIQLLPKHALNLPVNFWNIRRKFGLYVKKYKVHAILSNFREQNAEGGTNRLLSGFYFYQNYFTLRMDIAKISK